MGLKRLAVAETAPASKSKEEVPVVKISGRSVSRFVAATAAFKEAEAIQKEERAKLLEKGLQQLFEFNCANPGNPATSIKLMQDQGEDGETIPGDGEVVRMSFQNRYSACDADTADSLFTDLIKEHCGDRAAKDRPTINSFMQETVGAAFDSKIFNTGENGEFNQTVFNAYLAAITKTTEELVKKGVLPVGTKAPLGITKKVLPLANFHAERWSTFPSADAQRQLHEVVSTTVTLTPVAAK